MKSLLILLVIGTLTVSPINGLSKSVDSSASAASSNLVASPPKIEQKPTVVDTKSPGETKGKDKVGTKSGETLPPPTLKEIPYLMSGVGFSTVIFLLGCFGWVIRGIYKDPKNGDREWRIADALSEEVTFVNEGKSSQVLVASTSRIIAMFGMIVILTIFLGTGFVVVLDLALAGTPPSDLNIVMKFLAAGGTLFAPYLFNQVKAAFEKKTTPTPIQN